MCCGVVSLCQSADELQVVCARRELTDCVIWPVSHTFMPFTHSSSSSSIFSYFSPSRHWELDASFTFQTCGGNQKCRCEFQSVVKF